MNVRLILDSSLLALKNHHSVNSEGVLVGDACISNLAVFYQSGLTSFWVRMLRCRSIYAKLRVRSLNSRVNKVEGHDVVLQQEE